MFYLIQFFKTYGLSPMKTFFFWAFTLLVLLLALLSPEINRHVGDYHNARNTSYFYALVESSSSAEELVPRLNSIAGIHSIKLENEEEMKQLFSTVMKDLDLDPALKNELTGGHFLGLKINLKPENLTTINDDIRSQIQGIFGADAVTLTSIKSPTKTETGIDVILYKNAAQILLLTALLFWSLSLWSWSEVVRKKAYLIEEFSRKVNVCFKICIAGLSFFLGIAFLSMIALSQGAKGLIPSIGILETSTVALLFVLASMTFLKKWKWAE
ncbi:MAG: hypothetical protein ACOYL6_01150 [Bacteriovoracaceae bacterium]